MGKGAGLWHWEEEEEEEDGVGVERNLKSFQRRMKWSEGTGSIFGN